ncbi:CvpA family protein [Blattabacterium cuenoti]|uniref:CvpA family protein n=1 Tax=Blattabacterium cuenoti TaxID=1653831 RepID=UPI00163C59FA|nr:CvpA family protein [Blattabacterium cuenoti]
MTYLDIIIIIVVIYGGYNGYQKGLIYQFFISMIFFLILYKGTFVFEFVKNILQYFKFYNKNKYLFTVYSLIISFFSIIIFTYIAKKILEFFMMITCVKPIDKFFGGILGIMKYFLYISISIFFMKEINYQLNLISHNLFKNSFEKIFHFFLCKKEFLLYKIREFYFCSFKIIK